jgi:tRNA-2-methylthio-N6-dimethylallyladenosine synthase
MGSLYPHVDLIFGTHNLHLLPEMLERVTRTREQVVDIWEGAREVVEDLPARREEGLRAWVTVIHGCDKFCTYCIVPHTRGRERSRRPEDIRREVEELAARGFKEVTLLGQNVSSYGKDLDGYGFGDLLRDLNRIPGIEWIRFLTSHPRDFSPELVDLIAGLDKVCEHFHPPVQAGSNRVLRRMNRGYTRERYLALVEHIRKRIPGAAVTTDLIVGFPGEEEEDFRETLDLVRQADFDHAFLFIYSPRRGTPAARWEDRTSPEEKKERFDRLAELQYSISLRRNRALLGQRHKVLFEGPSKKDPAVWTARNRQNRLFLIPGPGPAGNGHPGPFAEVRVEEAGTFTLRASLLGFSEDGRDPALRLTS